MTSLRDAARPPARRFRAVLLVAAGIAAAVGLAAIYGIAGFLRNPAVSVACTEARATAQRIAPLARGEVAALTIAANPQVLPELTFTDGAGAHRSIADWRGRVVLLNLWATWCVPCRVEMPALDALQEKLGAPGFEVVAVNIDTRNPDKPKAWLADTRIKHLGYFADPSAKVFQELRAIGKAFGMPTTLLVDRNGCEIGSIAGPADWVSADALRLLEAVLKR